ncbi:MAG: NitT/TauT family transport system ATP-binding protein [Desulfovibrionales bacterium]|nr:NitT/TauT family transport system ATP-binding protein [Desulfovibrionales bacterium]
MLTAQGLTKAYPGGEAVLEDVSFELGPEETLSVVGPSGCGKTTLLYLLCGLLLPDKGEATLAGRPVRKPTPEAAVVLQDYGLLPWRTVLENAALGLKLQGAPRRKREEEARRQLAAMGLAGRERDYPSMLSGGEKQRVAIARAFACRPKLLLMDEPFSSLDAMTREKLQDAMIEQWRKHRLPWVVVTHGLDEAALLGKKILVLAGRPARAAAAFDNPMFGDPEQRNMKEHFELVRSLRQSLENAG